MRLGTGGGERWPDPRVETVIVYNGHNHFCGLCLPAWQKPPGEDPMWPVSGWDAATCPSLHGYLQYHGIALWPSTGKGFCGAESGAMSRMLLSGAWGEQGVG